jgi:CheY-like chemotaxis protein
MVKSEKVKTGSATRRKRLGEIFVEQGVLTTVSVQRMVVQAKNKGVRFGAFLEHIGLITPEELADGLASQYGCRRMRNFARHKFVPELLSMIPIDMAVEHAIFPLELEDGMLTLAVNDPTTEKLFAEIARKHDVHVIRFVSTRTDINRAIAKHYMGRAVVDAGEKSILLVEEDELVRNIVSDTLQRHGYTVETASDPTEAFKLIFTGRPMLIITDRIMSKLGRDEFLDALRNIPEFRFTPVILMTANATPEEEQIAFKKGFFDVILKPAKVITLLTRVQRAFQSIEHSIGKTA